MEPSNQSQFKRSFSFWTYVFVIAGAVIIVGLAALGGYQLLSRPRFPISSPIVSPEISPAIVSSPKLSEGEEAVGEEEEDEFVNWKTYRNEEYYEPYSLKYHNNWIVNTRVIDSIIYATLSNNQQGENKCSIEISDLAPGVAFDWSATTEEIIIDEKLLEKRTFKNSAGEVEKITILKIGEPGERIFGIYIDMAKNNEDECLVVSNQILSTFKFLE